MAEFVFIKKDDVETLGGPVTPQALREIYAPKGWREATPDEVRDFEYGVAQRQETQQGLTAAKIDEIVASGGSLTQIAYDRGVDASQFEDDEQAELAAAIKATL
jgi:hypothetical protein